MSGETPALPYAEIEGSTAMLTHFGHASYAVGEVDLQADELQVRPRVRRPRRLAGEPCSVTAVEVSGLSTKLVQKRGRGVPSLPNFAVDDKWSWFCAEVLS